MKKRMDEMDRQIQLLSEERGYRAIVLVGRRFSGGRRMRLCPR